jgi:hypothetical protein
VDACVAQNMRVAHCIPKSDEIQTKDSYPQWCLVRDLITRGNRVPEVHVHEITIAGSLPFDTCSASGILPSFKSLPSFTVSFFPEKALGIFAKDALELAFAQKPGGLVSFECFLIVVPVAAEHDSAC